MLNRDEVNYGLEVSVSMLRKKWIFLDSPPCIDGQDVTQERVKNRRRDGAGTITGFSSHGEIRVVRHKDDSEAVYWFDELNVSRRVAEEST